jgi:hypothetical protein
MQSGGRRNIGEAREEWNARRLPARRRMDAAAGNALCGELSGDPGESGQP